MPGVQSTSTARCPHQRRRRTRPHLAGLLPVELALHGWDFAQTCGVKLDISDEVVAYLRTLAEGIDPVGRKNGSFKAAVTAPEGASAIDQLAAFAGRTPLHG